MNWSRPSRQTDGRAKKSRPRGVSVFRRCEKCSKPRNCINRLCKGCRDGE